MARAVLDPVEIRWARLLDIALAELATGFRLVPQLSLGRMVALPDTTSRVLHNRVDFVIIDAAGAPVAAMEVVAGHARDVGAGRRWIASRAMLEAAGIACLEITASTSIEALFGWLAGIMGAQDPADEGLLAAG